MHWLSVSVLEPVHCTAHLAALMWHTRATYQALYTASR